MRIRDGKIQIRDPGKKSDPGSGINTPDATLLVPIESTFLRVEYFLRYSAIFMKNGRVLQKELTLYGNRYYNKKEKGRPLLFCTIIPVTE
jgi:hypothetical protein